MYTTKRYTAHLPLAELVERFRDAERFLPYCKACQNYAAVWSCPPSIPDFEAYTADCHEALIVAIKICYTDKAREIATTPDKVKELSWSTLLEVKNGFHQDMLALEAQHEKSLYLSSGGCTLCPVCQRGKGKACIKKEQMRYSLDAFGFDLSAITEELLGIELIWSKGDLPAYYTLIHALFSPTSVEID